ncbi:MAG TPA: zf-HC2 domain-containing protein [Clostridiaceae bacterium]
MDCDVIKDLIPLYIEKLTSEQTNNLIETHIKNCDDCKLTLNKLQEEIITHNKDVKFDEVEKLPIKLMRRIKRNITEKTLIVAVIILLIGIMLGIFRAKIFMFFAFIGTISIFSFTIAIFLAIPICRRKASLKKQFKTLGNWVFLLSIIICGFFFIIFRWYFNEFNKICIIIVLEIFYNIILSLSLRIYSRVKLPKYDIVDNENPLYKKLFIVTFITLIFIATVITVPVTLLEVNRKVDTISLGFATDSDVLGRWTSVDFVSSPEKFKPNKQIWKGELLLKEIIFFENGNMRELYNNETNTDTTIPTPWLLWSKGVVSHLGDHTASKYNIREINGSKYMFLEFKSGDYSYLRQPPSYVVLKKDIAGGK